MKPSAFSSSASAPAVELTLRPRPLLICAGLALHIAVASSALRAGGWPAGGLGLILTGAGYWLWLRMTGASLPGALRTAALHADGSWTLTDTRGFHVAATLTGAPVVRPGAMLLVWSGEQGRRQFALCLPGPSAQERLRPLRAWLRSRREA